MEPHSDGNAKPGNSSGLPNSPTHRIAPGYFVLGILGILAIGGLTYAASLMIGLERITAFVSRAGMFGPVAIIVLKSLTVVWMPLTGAPLYPLVGVLYGNVVGTIYIVIADLIGACIAFWIARRFGVRGITKLFGQRAANRIETLSHGGDWRAFLMMRVLLPPGIQEIINYLGGFLRISFLQFVVISVISFVPYTAIFVGSGTVFGASPRWQVMYGIGVAFYVLVILIALYRRRKR